MSIRIFVTGGTFDKEYNEISEQLVFKETHIEDMLRRGRCKVKVEVTTLMLIDSLHMTEHERTLVAEQCQKAEEDKILITHGTGTMTETAKVLAQTIKDKTVVLTGAMVPYAFGSSDGLFNLGSAIAFVQALPPGIYIAMNGRCFTWDNVRKNSETGIFEEIN